MYRNGIVLMSVWIAVAVVGCTRSSQGLTVHGAESLCVRYATEPDAELKARIAANQDVTTMAAIDRGEVTPGLPALVAYCIHGAPIKRRKAATPEGEFEHVTFCRQPIGPGQPCEAAGPTLVIAADRIAANPAPAES